MLFGRATWFLGIVIVVAVTGPEATGYIHYPPMTLQSMCKDSHHIRVLKVEKFNKEKGVIVFENTECLKGQNSRHTSFRHVLRPADEGTKPIYDWLENGKSAVMFSIEGTGKTPVGIAYVFIDKHCYTVDYHRSAEAWLLIRAEPGMSSCYDGSVEQLRGFVKDILAGKEVKVPAKAPETKDAWAKRYKEVNDALKKIRDADKGKDQDSKKDRVDQQGDPIPDQALRRIGTTRLQHEGQVLSVAASDDGRFLASHGRDRTVRVWDAKDGRPLWAFELRAGEPWAFAFSRNGKELAGVSKSSTMQSPKGAFLRWDVTTGKELPNGRIRPAVDIRSIYQPYQVALACRDDGEFLAAETDLTGHFRGVKTDGADIILYLPDVAKSVTHLKGHIGRVMSVCFTKDARTLVSLGDDDTIRVWNTADGKEIAKLSAPPMKNHNLKGNHGVVAVSPDGKILAVSLPDKSTRLLDMAGRELRRLPSSEHLNALVFSADGKTLFTGGNLIEAWRVDTAEPIVLVGQPRNPLRALSLSPDGKLAAIADNHNRLRLVEVASGKSTFDREILCRSGISFSPLGKLLAVAPGDDTIALWDVATNLASEKTLPSELATKFRCEGRVDAFVFSPDGKRLATVEDGRTCRVYDIAAKQATLAIHPTNRRIYAVAFSPDGKLLATSGEQPFGYGEQKQKSPQSVGLWDSFTGKELATDEDLRQLAHTVAFHPSGKSLAALHLPVVARNLLQSGARDIQASSIPVEDRMETIRLWDVGFARVKIRFEDAVKRKVAEGAGAWITGRSQPVPAAFSPGGWLFAAPGPGGIVVFETASGHPRLRLGGHLQEITALAFTPDGKSMVSTSFDSTALIWDVSGLRTGVKLTGSSEELWDYLADANAEKAGRAIWAMVDAPAESLAMLRKNLRPFSVSQASLQKLIVELDHPTFTVRDKAARELAKMGAFAEAALTKQLQADPSLEASRRIQTLLTEIQSMRPLPEHLQAIRAVEVLERIGSREVGIFLRELAGGSESAFLTRYARETLDRMQWRPHTK